MGEAPFKRGDIVCYVYPASPQWHGTIAIVDYCDPAQEYSTRILEYLLVAPGFPYNGKTRHDGNWLERAWEKIGEVPDADI